MFKTQWKLDTVSYGADLFITEEDGSAIAYGRIWPDGDNLRIGRIRAEEQYIGQPFEELVIRMLLYKAEGLSGRLVIAEPENETQEALLSRFGFKAAEDGFSVPRDKIIWWSECRD